MANPSSSTPLANPASSIISAHFCAPYPIDLVIDKKAVLITADDDFVVADINGDMLFKVKGNYGRRVLIDAAENPLVTLKQKAMSAHDRWRVFKGDSTDSNDLVFTTKRTSMLQLKIKLDVFLANNTKEDVCDFKVKGSYSDKSCVIYAGESSTIVAQVQKTKQSVKSMLSGKDKFVVTVHPNVDYAFIIAIIVILDGMIFPTTVAAPAAPPPVVFC